MIATPTTSLDELVAAANAYAARRWKVIPLTDGKRPYGITAWQNRQFSPADFRQCDGRPVVGVGVQLGPMSGIIDAEWDTESQYDKLVELCGGALPAGPRFASRKGGHALFAWDGRFDAIGGAVVDLPADDGTTLKIRVGSGGKGAQSAFPPSANKAWQPGHSPDDLPVPAAPGLLIAAMLGAASAKGKRSGAGGDWSEHTFHDAMIATCRAALAEMPESVSGENGQRAFMAAMRTGRQHVGNHEQALELAHWFNANRAVPPFDDDEVERKLGQSDEPPRTHAIDDFDTIDAPAEWAQGQSPRLLRMMRWSEFQAADFPQRYLIPGIVVENEHLIIGGRTKGLKTMISLDMMISLASGQPFLGHFPVTAACPVGFLSGESGKATLQRAALQMAKTRGAIIPDDNFFIDFELPKLSRPEDLAAIGDTIRAYGIKLLCIDPAYLCTLNAGNADKAGNQFAMGLVLEPFGRIGVETGCTMALVHHAKKASKAEAFKPMSRDDLTQSGFDAWMRQWILISPLTRFRQGIHDLHVAVGGSAGHSGEYSVTVDEGQPTDPLVGRRWNVTVQDVGTAATSADSAQLETDASTGLAAVLNESSRQLSRRSFCKAINAGMDKGGRADWAIAHLEATGRVTVKRTTRGTTEHVTIVAADCNGRTATK